MKKNGKKIFLGLLILTLVGVVGYGVYSYYWASGSVTHTGTIEVDGFNVVLYDSASLNTDLDPAQFIAGNHTSSLDCRYVGNENFICERSIQIDTSNDVEIEISNLDATVEGVDGASVISVSTNFDGDTFTMDTNGREYYQIIVEVEVPGYVEPSDEAVEVTEAIPGGEIEVTASYVITATEVHN